MRRLKNERGVTAIVVMLTTVAMFGIGAVVVDVAALLQEKRVLQNGADAAALAIAEQCGIGECGDPTADANEYTDANAEDGASTVEELCGSGVTGVSACDDPPDVPEGAGYVQVTTLTDEAGNDKVPFFFAQLLGFDGSSVRARATAAWGGPSSLTSDLPLTISKCEFEEFTSNGTDLEDPPPYDTSGYPSPERVIVFHNGQNAAGVCPSGPAGSDLPGGFGWLSTGENDCYATSDTEGWYDDKTGRPPPSDCDVPEMAALIGTIVHLPIFDETNGLNGTNGEYHMMGFAAFYLTGYSIEGQYKEQSIVSGGFPCNGSTSCISGFFVNDPTPTTGTIGGPSMGVTVVALIG